MATNQETRHAAFRTLAGGTAGTYNEDLIAASTAVTGKSGLGVNGQEMELPKSLTGSTTALSQTDLRAAMAAINGVSTWSEVTTFASKAYDFTTLSTLPSDITFTRASAAYYTDSAGALTSFASGDPRFGDRGFLLEGARTNLATYSQDFTNVAWGKSNCSVVATDIVAPDSTSTASTVTSTGDAALDAIISLTTGTAYRYSIWVKRNGVSDVSAQLMAADYGGPGVLARQAFTATSEWQRVTLSFTTSTTASHYLRLGAESTFSSGESLHIWGAQLEAGAFPTSYITTTSAAVTRAADVATVDTLGAWFNADEGTFVVGIEFNAAGGGASTQVVAMSDGTETNRVSVFANPSGFSKLSAAVSSATVAVITSITQQFTANGDTGKWAGAYKLNDYSLVGGGVVAGSDTSAAVPVVDRLMIGQQASGAGQTSTFIRSINYYGTRLPDATLQALTA
jgi:hypothetical protein